MSDTRRAWYRWLFGIAAVYDLALGIVFLFFGRQAFEWLGIADEFPEGGYLALIGAFVLVLGFAYGLIWRGDLVRNRDLVVTGTLYKLAYTAVGVTYAMTAGVPHPIFLWGFGVADAVFCVLMAECLYQLFRQRRDDEVALSQQEYSMT
jgi:hypothetical protein